VDSVASLPTEDHGKEAIARPVWWVSSLRLGFLPVPLYIALIAVLHLALPQELAASLVFDPPVLMLVLNTVLLFGVSVAVAATAMRAYLASGATSILLLGCGVLALGSAALVGGWVRPLGGSANSSVTVHNLGVLLAAALHAMSAILTLVAAEPKRGAATRRSRLLAGYAGMFVAMGLITAATLGGLVPPFWMPGVGSTSLKQAVLGTAVTLFALTAIYTMALFAQSGRRFVYWYSLALALTAVGLIGISLMKAVGDPIGWLGRTAQYLGGVYFLLAALSVLHEARARGLTLGTAIERFYRQSEVHYRDLVETVDDAIISVDERRRVLLWNQGAERMLGYASSEAAGRAIDELVLPVGRDGRLEAELAALHEERADRVAAGRIEIEMRRKDGSVFPSETSLSARRIGSAWTGTLVIRDITDRRRAEERLRAALAEKEAALANNETLLYEVHHRVKNNLQMLCDMLYLQMEALTDEKAEVLRDTYGRIYAIARLHETLYQSMQSGRIDLGRYLRRLVDGFESLYSTVPVEIDACTDGVGIDLDRAIHVGLIVNELVTNALKHAFAATRGEVRVGLRAIGEELELQVRDTGRGIPPGLDLEHATTLGLRIVRILARRLDARVSVRSAAGSGTTFTVTFPVG
jgi:PAS domain S-box-containing protein